MLTVEATSRELMARAQQGDRDAFGQLARLARPYISGAIKRRVAPDLIDDLIQETLLRAWRNIGTYRPTGTDVRAWLAQIARHVVVDHYRMRQARIREILTDTPIDAPAPDPYPAVDDHEQVGQVLAGLADIHREVLALRYLGELSDVEISARTGLALGTVKSRIFHARRAARELVTANA